MANKSLTLTIVIPAYNEERYIGACLDAIAKQTIKPDEVIVVDNNSSDNSAEIAQSYKWVKLLHEPTQGIVYARNTGFNVAKSQLIGRIDSDTILAKDWVEKAKKYFANHKQVAAVSGVNYFYDFPLRGLTHFLHTFTYYVLQKWIAGTDILWGSNMVIQRTAWEQVRQSTDKTNAGHEDIDLTLRLKKASLKIKRSSVLKAEVSMRRGDLSTRNLARYLSAWHRAYLINGLYFRVIFIFLLEALTLLTAIVSMPILKIFNLFKPMPLNKA